MCSFAGSIKQCRDLMLAFFLNVNLLQKYHRFVSGSEYGMADLHFYPVFERLPAICNLGYDVVPADKFPRLVAWTSAVQQLDFVRKEWVSANLYCHFIASQKAGSPDYEMQMDEETIAMQNSVA